MKAIVVPLRLVAALAAACLVVAGCRSREEGKSTSQASRPESSEADTPAPGVLPDVPHPKWSMQEFWAVVEAGKVPILDVRLPQEFQAGHVPGALNLPLQDFANDYERLRSKLDPHKDKIVAVYCSSHWCETSDLVQLRLMVLGFKHVARIPGGWAEWQQAGLPVEKSPAERKSP